MLNNAPTLYNERYRPQYHFSVQSGWMNDPNGLIYFENEYHLFFQFFPHGTTWSTMHWGHAISADLVHWEQVPIALFPDKNGAIFSGCVVIDAHNTSGLVPNGGMVAIFSYQNQTQGLAFSDDKGRTWTKYAGNPVLDNPGPTQDFRDPKVFWHSPTQAWIMAIVAQDRVKFYRSSNLIEWDFMSEFGETHGSHGGVWECPDLFPQLIEGQSKWVLLISVGDNAVAGGSGTQYFIGDFDGVTFKNDNPPDSVLWLDYGKDNYAGVTWANMPDSRQVLIGWLNNWKYGNQIPTSTWRGAMTIPRKLGLRYLADQSVRLVQQPIQELEQLRDQPNAWNAIPLLPEAPFSVQIPGQSIEAIATIQLGDAALVGVNLRWASDQVLSIVYNRQTSRLTVDRMNSGDSSFSDHFAGIFHTPLSSTDGQIRLHLFIDRSSVEVFANDGEVVLTNQIFPSMGDTHIEVYSAEGTATLVAFTHYNLARIWPSI